MTSSKTTKRALLGSVVAMLVCFTMLLSTTFAWFTDTAVSASNKIIAGNLDVVLEYKNDWSESWKPVDETTKIFKEGALYEPGYTEVVYLRVSNAGSLALKYNLMVNVTNEKGSINVEGDPFKLSENLQIGTYVQDEYSSGFNYADILIPTMFGTREAALSNVGTLTKLSEASSVIKSDAPVLAGDETAQVVAIVLTMPEAVGNEANYDATKATAPTLDLGVTLVATQLNSEKDTFGSDYDKDSEYPVISTVDTWDGTASFALFGLTGLSATASTAEVEDAITEAKATGTFLADDEIVIGSAEELAAFAKLVDAGETFAGKTVKLGSDIDLANILFEPIGSYRKDLAFKGTFDGQGHTISNMSQNTWELDNGYYYGDLGLGLFGKVEDAVIKNLTVDAASISGESAICGAVAATAYGECKFENIKVTNSKVNDYQYYAGGIVGWASGDHQYVGCNVDASTTIGGQWGDFGNANGGLIGGAGSSGTYYFKDCDVACRIDAVNDVVSAYQWYNYRNSGMLIGRTGHTETSDAVTNVAAPNVTCENVTVTYGDWANYTYCEFAGTGYPYVRVQAGVSVDAYSNVRYGHPTDANGNVVVDDNHVHNDGEDHHVLIVFDQLFGGPADQRYCQYGVATHPGVTVVYNNK